MKIFTIAELNDIVELFDQKEWDMREIADKYRVSYATIFATLNEYFSIDVGDALADIKENRQNSLNTNCPECKKGTLGHSSRDHSTFGKLSIKRELPGKRRLTPTQRSEMKKLSESGASTSDLMAQFGVSRGTVNKILKSALANNSKSGL